MSWSLDPRLEADSVAVTSLPLCDVRLMRDARWPWLVLVPRVAGLTEWVDLDPASQHRLADEISRASAALRRLHAPDKLNVASLGNVVAQLHVHVLGRYRDDPAWPGPVWGVAGPRAYPAAELQDAVGSFAAALGAGAA